MNPKTFYSILRIEKYVFVNKNSQGVECKHRSKISMALLSSPPNSILIFSTKCGGEKGAKPKVSANNRKKYIGVFTKNDFTIFTFRPFSQIQISIPWLQSHQFYKKYRVHLRPLD